MTNKYDFTGINILISEDEPTLVELYKEYLLDTNCNLIFFDLDKKSDILKIISDNNVNIVIMDIRLTNNYDGHDLIKKIRKKYKDLVIIALTSLSSEKDIEKSIKRGANYHINKPIDKDILLNGVKLYSQI